ncbi:dihydropyrimidinase [Planococcus sp. N028]|uniref:Dihydropyrimidinase n=1 Tax=Planococcus shixiaomingii TaxID=3058393 RepID=A0ABT8N1D4_9BACL|nr:dihydropyrimidinase [Planococcus sp. N028]MDN7241695.1 dihydropyrimidinase [Planococcus sp. N028]
MNKEILSRRKEGEFTTIKKGRENMLDTIIKNGTVVNANSTATVDIGIKDGIIVQIGDSNYFPDAKNVIDASGMEVYPGMIDSHVHINLKLGEFSTLDTFANATKAAAFGGTTTIVEFAIPYEGETPMDAFRRRSAEAENQCYVNYSFHGCFTEANIHEIQQVKELIDLGVPSIKMFTVYDDIVRINKGAIYDILKEIAANNGLALFHAENNEIITSEIAKHIEKENLSPAGHATSRPAIAEAEEVASLLALIEDTGASALFVHMSTGKTKELLEHYRKARNLPIFTEVCTHYLSLEGDVYKEKEGQLYICSPPIREQEEKEALWKMIDEGLVDVVNSDHCCYDTEQKNKYKDFFPNAPNGLPGVETRGIVYYSEGVQSGRLNRQQFAATTSTNTAKVMGMYPKKGKIDIGSDADLTIIDPASTQVITASNLHMQTDYTPFEGKEVKGRVAHTIVGGQHVVANGEFINEDFRGSFIKRTKPVN